MAVQLDSNGKDDLKTQFITREGTYRLMTLSEYSRPNRVGYTNNQSSPQVRVSIVTLPTSLPISQSLQQQQQLPNQQQQQTSTSLQPVQTTNLQINNGQDINNGQQQQQQQGGDRICFNFGKEIFVYAYRGVKKVKKIIF